MRCTDFNSNTSYISWLTKYTLVVARKTQLLSPVNAPPLNNNATCVYCGDDNAVCVNISDQGSCWCRAGYDKISDQCRMYSYYTTVNILLRI